MLIQLISARKHIVKTLPLDRCTVMQHLGVLEKAGLVIVKKEGKFRWNYLDVVPIRDIYDRWINQYALPSVELLTNLKKKARKIGDYFSVEMNLILTALND